MKAVPALQALNERLRQDYIEIARGRAALEQDHRKAGVNFEMKRTAASTARIVAFTGSRVARQQVLGEAEWKENEAKWLPTDEDRAYVTSLMGPAVVQPGKFALDRPAGAASTPAGGFQYVPIDGRQVLSRRHRCVTRWPQIPVHESRDRLSTDAETSFAGQFIAKFGLLVPAGGGLRSIPAAVVKG